MAADWTAIKLAYIHGTDTMRELAKKNEINSSGLMKRAAKEEWEAERQQESAKVSKAVSVTMLETKADLLAKFNDSDLKIANNLKAMISRNIQASEGNMEPNHIRTLASAASEAQRIGRLALGAETENTVVTTKELPSSVDEFV